MIEKDNLLGKFVTYVDRDGKTRTNKVVRIVGNTLTVQNVVKTRHRVCKDRVLGRQFRRRGLEEIKWRK